MKHLWIIAIAALGLTGCLHKHVVRDATVYQAELDQYESWAKRQAALLKDFVAEHCQCDEAKKFTTQRCADSADFILTVEARAAWHRAMSLHNAGLSEERPAETPPEIPASSTLCPAAVAPPAGGPN